MVTRDDFTIASQGGVDIRFARGEPGVLPEEWHQLACPKGSWRIVRQGQSAFIIGVSELVLAEQFETDLLREAEPYLWVGIRINNAGLTHFVEGVYGGRLVKTEVAHRGRGPSDAGWAIAIEEVLENGEPTPLVPPDEREIVFAQNLALMEEMVEAVRLLQAERASTVFLLEGIHTLLEGIAASLLMRDDGK
jgi:hypothetical protein